MGEAVGFKKITIQVLDEKLVPVAGKRYVIAGVTNEGAASSFEIDGLTKEATKVYGSNVPYYASQKGTGDVTATINILDFPFDAEADVLGFAKGTDEVFRIGEDTEAPYCSVLIETASMQGKVLGFGLYAGKFSKTVLQGSTLTDEAYEPEPTEYSFAAVSKTIGGKNYTVGYAVDETPFGVLSDETLGAEPSTPTGP